MMQSSFTGFPVAFTAAAASRNDVSAYSLSIRYSSTNDFVLMATLVTWTRQSGTFLSTASSIAHWAAWIAARDPSMPTTTGP
ncbi:Uncharacterised protein [Mycobacteroides abscessus subsp. abscessus]|nr:Uncharacterised protein [Mycobacteroides abscessus subsp. abscessus]